jgi:uncharacterized membrane protein
MAITSSIDIDRSPTDVFAYLDDLARHGEWQTQIVSVKVEGDGPTKVGTHATEVRQVGKRKMTIEYEVTEHDPPKSFAFQGLNGPVRPFGRGTVEPLDDGKRSRVTITLDFEGHGFGKLILPLARRDAGKQVPLDQQRLKERLEAPST